MSKIKARSKKSDGFSSKFIKAQSVIIDDLIEEIGKKTLKFIRESRELQENDSRSADTDGDVADAANKFQNEAVRIGVASNDVEKLQALIVARRAILTGSYGSCSDCTKAISEKRLKVVPWAGRCIFCQKIYDREIS